MQVNISGQYDLVRLKEVAEDLKERLEQIPSILEVRLSGGLEREVQVDVDLNTCSSTGCVRRRRQRHPLGETSRSRAARSTSAPRSSWSAWTASSARTPTSSRTSWSPRNDGRPIYVRDVANVDFGFKDRTSYARLDGNPVVTLDIVKRSGENIIATADAVKAVIARRSSRPSRRPPR
jgi:multidrug efflux pump